MRPGRVARSLPALRWAWLAMPLLAAVLLLTGCGPQANSFAPYCPAPRRPEDAAALTIYRPGSGGRDITDLVLQGNITDISGVCKDGDQPGTVQADTAVTFRFQRGPAMPGRDIVVPFSLAVSLGDTIRDKATFRLHVVFPSNVDTVTLTSPPVHMVFPITKTTNAASYTIWAFFELTPEQLDYNRQHQQ